MKTKNNIPISVAIIARNEELRLPGCIESVRFADDIVVVDSESTDKTVSLAQNMGARVFVESWKGFGLQKQSAIDHCKHDWVLILDADERLSVEAMDEIRKAIMSTNSSAYSFPRKNYFWGRWIRFAGWWPDRTIRLFRKSRWRMANRLVHEALEGTDKAGKLQNPIFHYTDKDLYHIIGKINQYSSLGSIELHKRGVRGTMGKAFGRAFWAFLHGYFFRVGFLDSKEGFLLAVLNSMNTYLKYMKLVELQTIKHSAINGFIDNNR